jgi:hypothetical protein
VSFTQDERVEQRAPESPPDPISQALGAKVFVRNHRLGNLHIATPMGRSPRLSVSRFYWDLDPQIVVDFFKELKRGKAEYEAKKAYCAERGIRYILAADEWDEEAVRGRMEPDTEEPAAPLRTAPRRTKTEVQSHGS